MQNNDINTFNKCLVVGTGGNGVRILNFPVGSMTPDDALLLAAWLVAVAQPDATYRFNDVLKAVMNE